MAPYDDSHPHAAALRGPRPRCRQAAQLAHRLRHPVQRSGASIERSTWPHMRREYGRQPTTDVQLLRRLADIVDLPLERELGRVGTDDDERLVLVLLGPCTDVAQRAQPIDARVRPEVDEDDPPSSASALSGSELSQPLAPSKPGRWPWRPRRVPNRLTSRSRLRRGLPRRTRSGLPGEGCARCRPRSCDANTRPRTSGHRRSAPGGVHRWHRPRA
jgi:hypothetical protein